VRHQNASLAGQPSVDMGGNAMMVSRSFSICFTGNGVRQTLEILPRYIASG
jgi:hypothetical protein